jgi:pyruvate dehydrogenase E2 component (dihydrolipoamide acetyltransferase)
MRRVIADRLQHSTFNIPHYSITVSLNVDALLKLREEVNASMNDKSEKVSLNDFFIKAAAIASAEFPETRSSWFGSEGFVRVSDRVDISFAVDTGSGLITPIVHNANKLRLKQISSVSKQLIEKAKSGKLKPEEYIGGTMSISNMGMFGIKQFSAIINPPQACILAVASPHKEMKADLAGETSALRVTMSFDHRVVDGAVGSQYLQRLKALIEKPMLILVN